MAKRGRSRATSSKSATRLDDGNMILSIVEEMGLFAEAEKPPIAARRRMRSSRAMAGAPILEVVERDDMLRFDLDSAAVSTGMRRMRRRAGTREDEEDVILRVPLESLPNDDVRTLVTKLDEKLTKNQGLHEYSDGALTEPRLPSSAAKRILLVIHGTFSHGMNILAPLVAAPGGAELMKEWHRRYDRILVFNHPTLSVDPFVNACRLAEALRGVDATVDIVCHSRGGLVSRWWAEVLDRGRAKVGRIVFVAAPLAGTGIAAPPNIRKTINTLGTIAKTLEYSSAVVPFMQAAVGIFHAISKALKFASTLPIVDAAVALFPGLRAMERVGNNTELHALRSERDIDAKNYWFVRSNFEPEDVLWSFWKRLRGDKSQRTFGGSVKDNILDAATDAIFDGENDLVVDTESMTDLFTKSKTMKSHILDYGTSRRVHHTNYFEQRETVEFLDRVLRG